MCTPCTREFKHLVASDLVSKQAHLLYRLPKKSATMGTCKGWLDKEQVDHRVLLFTRTQDRQPALRHAKTHVDARSDHA